MTKGSAVRVFIRWGCELRCIPQVGVRFARVREECRRSTIFFVRFRRFMPRKVTSISCPLIVDPSLTILGAGMEEPGLGELRVWFRGLLSRRVMCLAYVPVGFYSMFCLLSPSFCVSLVLCLRVLRSISADV